MNLSYRLILTLYRVAAPFVASLGRYGLLGRKIKTWFTNRKKLSIHDTNSGSTLLFFCASAGELGKVLPIIEHFHQCGVRQEVGFFSPSGYTQSEHLLPKDIRKSFAPIDTPKQVDEYFSDRTPQLTIIAANDIWPMTLEYLCKHDIAYGFIGCSLIDSSPMKRWFHSVVSPVLQKAAFIGASHTSTLDYLKSLDVSDNVMLTGDPRIESILKRGSIKPLPAGISTWLYGKKTFAFASTHREDYKQLPSLLPKLRKLGFQIIIIPHDSDPVEIKELQALIPDSVTSDMDDLSGANTLIVTEWGLLTSLYPKMHHVYVGGGFGPGVHNVTEALSCRGHIFIGPAHLRFPEVSDYIEGGLVTEVCALTEIPDKMVDVYNDKSQYIGKSKSKHEGACELSIQLINQIL